MTDVLAPLRGYEPYEYDADTETIIGAEGRVIILRSRNVQIGQAVAAALNYALTHWEVPDGITE